jgi:hypothetical protein
MSPDEIQEALNYTPHRNIYRKSFPLNLNESIDLSLETGFLYFIDLKIKVFDAFPRAVGKVLAERVKATYYDAGILTVFVTEPAYLERCQYLKKNWLKRLEIELGCALVTEIVLKLKTN